MPKALDAVYADVIREAKVEEARGHAAQLLSDGKAALARSDAAAARKAVAGMAALLNELRTEFKLRIINRAGEASGVWREPAINPLARNYYLIVEAIAPNGKVLTRPILNEKTGVTAKADKWGIRLGRELFEKVIEGKREDGLIEHNIVGQKKRGYLDVDYAVPILGGTITKW